MNDAEIIPLDLAKENTKDFDVRILQIFKKYICD
jgi:hypothetical protein